MDSVPEHDGKGLASDVKSFATQATDDILAEHDRSLRNGHCWGLILFNKNMRL